MPIRLSLLSLLLLGTAAHAQEGNSTGRRIDVLTGEPVQPRAAPHRPEPQIFNAPHAPRQVARGPEDSPPMEIYIAPQIGTGSDGLSLNNGMPMGRPLRRQ